MATPTVWSLGGGGSLACQVMVMVSVVGQAASYSAFKSVLLSDALGEVQVTEPDVCVVRGL